MDVAAAVDAHTGPTWIAALGTVASYVFLLAVMTVLLFVVPYLVFVAL